jgi:ubiquinone/menaquinone biosynthesis C-methylase UbiE
METTSEKPIPTTTDQERRARALETEVYPLLGERLADLLTRDDGGPRGGKVLQLGCGLGETTAHLMRRLTIGSQVMVVEANDALIERARARIPAGIMDGQVFFHVASVHAPLPFPAEEFDAVVANVALADLPDPGVLLAEFKRVLRPKGTLHLATTIEGTWREFLDIYSDVLYRLRNQAMIDALLAYARSFPDAELLACQLETMGFAKVAVETSRFDLVFRSAREFFYSPVIELGPLPRWKAIAGKGAAMQDVLFAVKEAIDVYFGARPFSVGVYAGHFTGVKSEE